MATDWTFDLFVEDCNKYTVEDADSDDYRAYFIGRMKLGVENFKKEIWDDEHLYVRGKGYIGDAFAERLLDGWFSDFYKDAYGQRPHLPIWFYVHQLGLPMQEDTARLFCASPVENAVSNAQRVRKFYEEYDR